MKGEIEEPISERKPKNALREALASTGLPANESGHGCDVSTTGAQPEQPFIAMTMLNSRLQLALLNRKKGRNLLEKGFTLVELMIVIVIVGILSSVALPQFLSQSEKAKATEAKSNSSAIFKNAAAGYQEGIVVDDTTACETAPVTKTTKFDYACTFDDGSPAADGDPSTAATLLVVATGNGAGEGGDANISGKKLTSCYNFANGKTVMDSGLNPTTPTTAANCKA